MGLKSGMRSLCIFFLLLPAAVASVPLEPRDVKVEAQFLNRGDLPDDFTFPMMRFGFGVLRLRFTNNGEQPWVTPSEAEVRASKGKPIRRATPQEITPRIVNSKVYRSSNRNVHGVVTVGDPLPSARPRYERYPGPTGPVGAGKVSVTNAQEIRKVLESHELREMILKPGQSVEMLVYLKTKKKPTQLAGYQVSIPGLGMYPTQ